MNFPPPDGHAMERLHPSHIRRVCVLGAGVMGSQIAALIADAGVDVYLLDRVSDGATTPGERNHYALKAIAGLRTLKPSPVVSLESLKRITPGNFDDHMSCVAECDWIVEAVIEDLAIKQKIHLDVSKYKRKDVMVSTNTSGILLSDISRHLPSAYSAMFMGTHFFNPPRYTKLVEIIAHDSQNSTEGSQAAQLLTDWICHHLDKVAVYGLDTINFVANRIGVFSLCSVARHAEKLNLNPETVDALTGKLLGRPSSATYRTMDVVGLDVASKVAANVYDSKHEPFEDRGRESFVFPDWVKDLVSKGHLGQKSGFKGIYEKTKVQGKTLIRSYDPETQSYTDLNPRTFAWMKEAQGKSRFFDRLSFLISCDDEGGQLIWHSLRELFSYSAHMVTHIADGDVYTLDLAVKHGFNWQYGVFETWQGLGFSQITRRMMNEGVALPPWVQNVAGSETFKFYQPSPDSDHWILGPVQGLHNTAWNASLKRYANTSDRYVSELGLLNHYSEDDPRLVEGNEAASLLNMGEGAYLMNFHTKMNAINSDMLEMIKQAVVITAKTKDAGTLVVANRGKVFSAGADLQMLLGLIQQESYDEIDHMLRQFQEAMQLLKFSVLPTIAAPHGMTLGGGCEVTLHAAHRHVYKETYVGLVEAGVGLVPAAGGCKELALRCYKLASEYGADPMVFLDKVFKTVAMAKVSSSAEEAIKIGLYDKASTTVHQSFSTHIDGAIQQGLLLKDHVYKPPLPAEGVKVAGEAGYESFRMMIYNMKEGKMISDHDALVAEKVAFVLCGGDVPRGTAVDESWFLDLERKVFVELCKEPKTVDRIGHMLKKGKPLRN